MKKKFILLFLYCRTQNEMKGTNICACEMARFANRIGFYYFRFVIKEDELVLHHWRKLFASS